MRPRTEGSRLSRPDACLHLHCADGVCHPKTRTHVALLGPCFKTGRMQPFEHQQPRHKAWPTPRQSGRTVGGHCTQSPPRDPNGRRRPGPPRGEGLCRTRESSRLSSVAPGPPDGTAIRAPHECGDTSRPTFWAWTDRCWPAPNRSAEQSRDSPGNGTAETRRIPRPPLNLIRSHFSCIRFPPNGFAVFLTLFSKYFSPFPHGTCSLSVSCRYLALDGVYHPLWAAFPNNPTLRRR